jgi:hypothetical protein
VSENQHPIHITVPLGRGRPLSDAPETHSFGQAHTGEVVNRNVRIELPHAKAAHSELADEA